MSFHIRCARRRRLRAAMALALTVAWPMLARAQSARGPEAPGAIHGHVVDAETGEPVADVLVIAEDANPRAGGHAGPHRPGATTDGAGRFVLDDVPAGPYTLVASIVGYALARREVIVASGRTIELTLPLAAGTGAYTEQVTVRAGDESPRATAPVEFRMRSAELQELRGVLADDPFRAIQAMPGVATGDDFRAEFSVRGSEFRQMGFAVEGVAAPWLVHGPRAVTDTGTVAMVNADVLSEIGLASGASPQPYGNRTGAWVQTALREGSRDALRLTGSLSGTGASTVLEGPIGRSRRGAWLASARKSYIDWLIAQLDIEENSRFGFSDAQSKVVVDVTPRQQLQLTAVAGRSRYRETEPVPGANDIELADTTSGLVVGTWRSTFGQALVVTQRASWASLRYENRGGAGQALARGTEDTSSYRVDATAVARPWLTGDLGGVVDRDTGAFTFWQYSATGFSIPLLRSRSQWTHERWRLGGYARARFTPHRAVTIDTGTRLDREWLRGAASASPWLLARW